MSPSFVFSPKGREPYRTREAQQPTLDSNHTHIAQAVVRERACVGKSRHDAILEATPCGETYENSEGVWEASGAAGKAIEHETHSGKVDHGF